MSNKNLEESGRCSEEQLQELHGQLARTLRNIVIGGEVVKNLDGQPVTLTPSPAALGVVRQFLKDNNVQANPATNPDIKDLTDSLPFRDNNDSRPPN